MLFDPLIDSMGVACSCHPEFGEVCVFEFGIGVVPKDEYEINVSEMNKRTSTGVLHPIDHLNNPEMPVFKLPGDPTCDVDRTDGFCGEVATPDDDQAEPPHPTVYIDYYDELVDPTRDRSH